MKLVHLLYPEETGCIYCKKINGLIKILEMKTPCLRCEKWRGAIQGEGCECEWDDFDFDRVPSIYDPVAEYDRVNDFKAVPKQERLREWKKRNEAAEKQYMRRHWSGYSVGGDTDGP